MSEKEVTVAPPQEDVDDWHVTTPAAALEELNSNPETGLDLSLIHI